MQFEFDSADKKLGYKGSFKNFNYCPTRLKKPTQK